MTARPGVAAVSRVAGLLSVQGTGQLALAVLELLTLPMMFATMARTHRPLPSNVEAAAMLAWLLAMGVGGLVSLRAGRLNRQYRGRRVAFVAFALGAGSCLVGLPILAYGLWTYRRPEVRRLFELGESGVAEWDIEHELESA